MRSLSILALVLGMAACFEASSSREQAVPPAAPDNDSGGGAGIAFQCVDDIDCELAGSSCCECPSFALPVADGFRDACEDVNCDPPASCSAVQAGCELGACVIQCSPVRCDMQCENGFVADEFGCLVCSCAVATPVAECADDVDCAQVPADCCGCERGGQDTAVPAGQVADHLAMLECPDDPACPGVNVCGPDYTPQCMFGQCMLGPATGEVDPALVPCGRTDLPACPAGQVCILNHPLANEAGLTGVGICRDA